MDQARDDAATGWRWVLVPLAIAVASRMFAIAVLVGGSIAAGVGRNPFIDWDGGWYGRVATSGYHAEFATGHAYDYAFFPGWPIVMRIVSLGSPQILAFAVVAANVLFVAGAVMAWRLLADRMGERTASGGLALLAFAPPSFVFSMAYSESLFFCLAACLLTTRPWLRTVLAAGASTVRLAGLALAATATAVLVVRRAGPRAMYVGMVVGSIAGFAAWFVYVAVLTQNPFGFLTGSRSWIVGSVLRHQLIILHGHELQFAAWFEFVGILLVGAILALRRDVELGAFATFSVLLALASLATVSANSVARYALPAFPAYAGLATRLGPRALAALTVAFALGEVAFDAWSQGSLRLPP